ncbi:B12-binding domain-containing radical SAM protein [Steroidobacter cummioxidans]|uniref:B12-binding domain-containing radical SAM protein n=1 Tax=Steroidobacter cummioxidans TaxID=1803913 RepID=UPI000E30C495|nr:radical SAM protein [Steroidobacter cummioxidans]
MKQRPTILLINPTITQRASARFPLAVLSLSVALEGRYRTRIIDGNIDRDFVATTLRYLANGDIGAIGMTIMGGPQLRTAITASRAVRERFPSVPIVWGGAFPTNCPHATLNVPYVDYAVRSQGEETFLELLDALSHQDSNALAAIRGLSWRDGEDIIHNPDREFSAASLGDRLPYETLENPTQYLSRTYLGERTAGYQAALGCRFRCTFCGVAATFKGRMALPTAPRLEQDLTFLTRVLGVDAIQFYDHNFFDREADMAPLLETLAKIQVPWWCFARADALVKLSERSWEWVRRSRLRMAYIGAESPSDWLLKHIRKGTRSDQTLAAIEVCRGHGVIPELSFMLAPPEDPEGETEKTFEFIHVLKRRYPETEIMIYLYTPLPPPPCGANPHVVRQMSSLRDVTGTPVVFPTTADGWAEPHWHAYWCHKDAPWISRRLHKRIRDFTTVLGCRFPTIIDVTAPAWQRRTLRALASWRYGLRKYDRPWELELSKKLARLRDPRALSL